jgi:hypothetical protein
MATLSKGKRSEYLKEERKKIKYLLTATKYLLIMATTNEETPNPNLLRG